MKRNNKPFKDWVCNPRDFKVEGFREIATGRLCRFEKMAVDYMGMDVIVVSFEEGDPHSTDGKEVTMVFEFKEFCQFYERVWLTFCMCGHIMRFKKKEENVGRKTDAIQAQIN